MRAFGDIANRAGQLAPRGDAVPFGELLTVVAFAPEAAGSQGEVEDGFAAVEILAAGIGSYEALHGRAVDVSLVRHCRFTLFCPFSRAPQRARGGHSQGKAGFFRWVPAFFLFAQRTGPL